MTSKGTRWATSYRDLIESWNRFWFTPSAPTTLALMRILCGAMLFYTHLVWSCDLAGFLGPSARISPTFVTTFHENAMRLPNVALDAPITHYGWSHLLHLESLSAIWAIHLGALVVLLLFTAGWQTRITSILSLLITISYLHRAAGALFGLDQINVVLAMYLAISPCGAAYSLDARSAAMRQKKSGRGAGRNSTGSTMATVATRLIQIHLCVIYFFAAVGKLRGITWWDGTAIWYSAANYQYQTLDMTWLAAHPYLVDLLTHVTLVWELSYAALVWPRRTRWLMIGLAVPLHLGIAFCMGMITFGFAMLIANLAFVPPEMVKNFLDRGEKIWGIRSDTDASRAGEGEGTA